MPDANWFYSTMAQSSAAVVGLAGGFMVSRILAQRSEIADDRTGARSNFLNVHSEIQRRAKNAAAVYDSVASELPDIRAQHTIPSSSPLRSFTYADFSNGPSLQIGDDDLARLEDLQAVSSSVRDMYTALSVSKGDLARHLRKDKRLVDLVEPWLSEDVRPPDENLGFLEGLHRQRDWLRNDFRSVNQSYETARGDLARVRNRLSLPTLWGLLAVLAGFLAFGVVVPFFYLSARPGSSRLSLIAIFIVLGVAFVLYLANEIRRLSHALRIGREWY